MTQVNVFETKTHLSKMLRMLENGEEDRFIIARNGRPVANLTLASREESISGFLGFKDGAYDIPDDIDGDNEEIAELFGA